MNITEQNLENYIIDKNKKGLELMLGIFNNQSNIYIGNIKFELNNINGHYAILYVHVVIAVICLYGKPLPDLDKESIISVIKQIIAFIKTY